MISTRLMQNVDVLNKEKKQKKSLDKIQFEKAIITKSSSSYTRMSELAKNVGWHQ